MDIRTHNRYPFSPNHPTRSFRKAYDWTSPIPPNTHTNRDPWCLHRYTSPPITTDLESFHILPSSVGDDLQDYERRGIVLHRGKFSLVYHCNNIITSDEVCAYYWPTVHMCYEPHRDKVIYGVSYTVYEYGDGTKKLDTLYHEFRQIFDLIGQSWSDISNGKIT